MDKRAKDPRWTERTKAKGQRERKFSNETRLVKSRNPLYSGFGNISWLVQVRDVASRLDTLDRRLN